MKPKNDFQTSTVDGAAAFEKANREFDDFDEEICVEELTEDDEEDDYEYCGCSDPGCPCYGSKKGSL